MTINFYVSRKFVFKNSNLEIRAQFVKYAAVIIFNLFIGTLIIGVLINLEFPAYLAKFLVAVLIATWTYFIYQKYIFSNNGSNNARN